VCWRWLSGVGMGGVGGKGGGDVERSGVGFGGTSF